MRGRNHQPPPTGDILSQGRNIKMPSKQMIESIRLKMQAEQQAMAKKEPYVGTPDLTPGVLAGNPLAIDLVARLEGDGEKKPHPDGET
jgi:hypothetical protein